MNLRDKLRVIKPVQWVYNLLHYAKLQHNKQGYKKYKIQKPLFASLSSKDFPDKTSTAWLDLQNAKDIATKHVEFSTFSPYLQEKITNWSNDGYMLLPNYFSDKKVDEINTEIETLLEQQKIKEILNHKLMFVNKISAVIDNITKEKELIKLLSFILGEKVVPFQTINFLKGSEQRAHSDSIHMTTYPLGYMIAEWIALEDIDETSGPLLYYPASHKLPYVLNEIYTRNGKNIPLAEREYTAYEDNIEKVITENKLEKKVFHAKKGDVFIWHANLIHGGSITLDKEKTRKSMVIHYFAENVIKYHEITERPSLM